MAFDFPSSPTNGQVISGPNGIQYQWDGVKWLAAGAVNTGGYAPVGAINNAGRNLIHNPLFNVWQRGVGPFTASGVTADRWGIMGDGTISIARATCDDAGRAAIGDEAALYFLNNNFTGAAGSGSYTALVQHIEGVRSLSGKTVTVSFWANSNASLKLGVSIDQSFGTGGSPSTLVGGNGQSVQLSTVMTRYSVTISVPSTIGKTLGTNGDDYTQLNFWYSAGTSLVARSGSVGVQSGVVNLWGAQLEIGSVATPLDKPGLQQDLAKCQRFYQVGQVVIGGYGTAGAGAGQTYTLPEPMRTLPTITPGSNSNINIGAPAFTAINGGAAIFVNAAVSATGLWALNQWFNASAEL